jgi:hypothetical protein
MELTQWLVLAAISALVTFLAIRFIPRDRQSPLFDWVLLGGTWLLAFFGALSAPNYIPANSPLNDYVIAGIRWIPLLIGAAVGALSINILLWLIDRFSQPTIEDNTEMESPESEDGGESGAGGAESEPPTEQ